MLSLADPQSKNHLHLFYKEYSEAQILCQADPLTGSKRHRLVLTCVDGLHMINVLKSYLNLYVYIH